MTRTEIDELIEYLEKNYHVKCNYVPASDDFDYDEVRVTPTLYYSIRNPLDNRQNKKIATEFLITKLDKLDLIRF